jgi:hypothetical protein
MRHKLTEQPERKWTIMVYMAGGKNISDAARESLLQMKLVGSTKDLNVIAQFDSGSEGERTKRYWLRPLARASEISRLLSEPTDLRTPILNAVLEADNFSPEDLNQTDTGNPAELSDFVAWGLGSFPSHRTMLIIWGHGDGFSVAWDVTPTSRIRRKKRKKSTHPSAGRTTETELTPGELRKAFKSLITRRGFPGQPNRNKLIDIFGFDSCQMGTVEVYHQLTDIAGFAIGSEGSTPTSSWPYTRILKALKEKPATKSAGLAKLIVREYDKAYTRNFGDGIDLSACKLSNLPVDAISGLVGPLKRLLRGDQNTRRLIAVRMDTQSYNDDFVDLHDLCRQLGQQFRKNKGLKNACNKVTAATKEAVLLSKDRGPSAKDSNGLSIYFPRDSQRRDGRISPLYGELQIKETHWKEFLDLYHKRKRRLRF